MDIKILKTGGLIFLLIFLIISIAFAREMNFDNQYPVQEPVQVASPTATPRPYELSDKINEGIELLKKSPALAYETKIVKLKNGKKVKTNELVQKQIALAVLDVNTGGIFEKRVWVNETEIQNYRQTGMVRLISADDVKIDVQPRLWNSFNSFYDIASRSELIVVANKYLVTTKQLGNLPERSKNKYSEIIYAPYSLALHHPDVINAGKKYLEKNTNLAFKELDNKPVQSKSFSGQPVTVVVSKDFIRNVILIEHIDPDSFAMAADGGKALTERVLAIIGANQDHAYRYTGSPAGASGIAQFIKPTYRTIVAKYPEAGLIEDYGLGMADHINAIKAMVLFFDLHKREIENKITKPEITKQLGITEEMLAAAYNGGPTRVVRSVNKYGLAWLSRQINLPKTQRIFRTETLEYLNKLRSISKLDLF